MYTLKHDQNRNEKTQEDLAEKVSSFKGLIWLGDQPVWDQKMVSSLIHDLCGYDRKS